MNSNIKYNESVRINFRFVDGKWNAIKIDEKTGKDFEKIGVGLSQLQALEDLQQKVSEDLGIF